MKIRFVLFFLVVGFGLPLSYSFAARNEVPGSGLHSETTLSLPAGYPSLWKKADSLTALGLPKSALEVVDQIYKKAKAEKNDPQFVKAILYRIRLQSDFGEDVLAASVNEVRAEIGTAGTPVKQILQSVLAELYTKYYQQNLYRFADRTRVSGNQEDSIQTWDLDMLTSRIIKTYLLSIENPGLLKSIPILQFEPILEQADKKTGSSARYRPTLFDFLAWRALDYFTSGEGKLNQPSTAFVINSRGYFDLPGSFITLPVWKTVPADSSLIYFALRTFRDLEAFHSSDPDPKALIDVALQRLAYVYREGTMEEKDSLYLSVLKNFEQQNLDSPSSTDITFTIAQFLNSQGQQYNPLVSDKHKWEIKEAAAYCESAIGRFPRSDGAHNCQELLKSIRRPFLKVTVENAVPPEKPFLSLVEFRNMTGIWFRLIQTDPETDREKTGSLSHEELVKYYAGLPAYKEWSRTFPSDGDFQNHSAESVIPAVPMGYYILLCSSDPEFRDPAQAIACVALYSTHLSYLNLNNETGGVDFYILDRETGQPVKEVSAEAFVRVYNYTTRTYEIRKTGEYRSDENGFFSIPSLPRGSNYTNFYLKLRSGNDLFLTDNIYQYPVAAKTEKKVLRTFFFTDRAIYRPGQTIYFKGIILEKTGEQYAILPGTQTVVTFSDANSQKVSEQAFSANDFGSFNGSFVAPQGVLPGQMTISNGSGFAMIRVEEYKRPTFEVMFEPVEGNYRLNDSVTVTGKAIAYAGNAIDGADVTFRVIRTARFPYWGKWWYPFPASPETEILNGKIRTGTGGTYRITFPAIPDRSIDKTMLPVFDYLIMADVTDLNGETQSAEETVSVGYTSLLLGINVPEKMNLDKDSVFLISSTNLSGRKTPAEVTVVLQRLSQPGRIFKKRFWERPDLNLMERQEFYSQFPYDVYAKEDLPEDWPVAETVYERTLNTANDSVFSFSQFAVRKGDGEWLLPDGSLLEQGSYLLTLRARDPFGVPVEKKTWLTAFSPASASLPGYDLNWFVPLKTTCEPGEKALFLIGSKEENVPVVFELRVRDSLVSRRWLKLDDNQRVVEIPVEESWRGGFQVTFLFVKHNRSFRNSQLITVPYTSRKLDIALETFRDRIYPGQKEEWRIHIADASKKGVEAELLASMYDASLDAFAENTWSFSLTRSLHYYPLWDISDAFRGSSGTGYLLVSEGNDFIFREYDRLNWFGFSYGGGLYYYKNKRSMTLAEELGKEMPMAVDKTAAKGDVVSAEEARSAGEPVIKQPKAPRPGEPEPVRVRKDFRETAFFYPSLVTDSSGNLVLSFTAPESLTRWKIMGFACTRDLKYGQFQKELVTRKELMVFPNAPRFVRRGDTVVFSTKVVNMSEHVLSGEVILELMDALTLRPVDLLTAGSSKQNAFRIEAGQSTVAGWTFVIPEDPQLNALQYRVVAAAGTFSDGEEKAIPVLTNRMRVTESLPLPVRGTGTFDFRFDRLLQSGTNTSLKNYRLTLEFASNPAWYAVQALSLLDEPLYPNADNLFNAFYANSIAIFIANSDPGLRRVFESWKNLTPDALLSNLEKNQQLKSALLQETPWVMEAKSETERKQKLGQLFDLNTLTEKLQQNLQKLKKLQKAGGGWTWFEGMPESRFITQNIVTGMGHLDHLGIANVRQDVETWNMLSKAIRYLDDQVAEDYKWIKKYDPGKLKEDHLGPVQVQYLYARSYFLKDIPLSSGILHTASDIREAFDYFKKQSETYWLKNDLYTQGMIALALKRLGNPEIPAGIMKSLSEKALHSKEMGMYWAMREGYEWYQAPVETQALLIEAFDEVAANREAVDEMKIWLLKQKQTQDWRTGRATAEACYALLLRGMDLLSAESGIRIHVGNETIDPGQLQDTQAEAGTGYFQVSWSGKEIVPEMGNVSVTRSGEGVAWGALYWQYFEDLDKITPARTPLKVEKKLFVEVNTPSGPVLEPVANDQPAMANETARQVLHTGEKLKVRIVLTVDRNLEFVHMKDMRASAFEPPVSEALSGYRYRDGLGYYQSTTDLAMNFFFDYLPKGTYVFEYPLLVNAAGEYSNGITTVQCMYAPEFAAHSEGIRVRVK